MTEDVDGIPVVEARVFEYARDTPGDSASYLLEITCPFCGRQHLHGAGNDFEKIPDYAGHRVAHCATEVAETDRGYVVFIPLPVQIDRTIPA